MKTEEILTSFLEKLNMKIEKRRPLYDDEPDGYYEGDLHFLDNNHELSAYLIEGGLEDLIKHTVEICCSQFLEMRTQPDELVLKEIQSRFGICDE